MRKAFTFNYVLYGIVYAAIFSAIGVFNLAFAEWDVGVLTTANYWFRTGTNSLTYIIAYQIAVNLSADIYTQTHKQYNEILEEVEKSVKKLNSNFRDFVFDYNFREKKNVWVRKITNKLIKHNEKQTLAMVEEMRLNQPDQWTKKTTNWAKKRDMLKLHLTEEWINENLPYVKLVYPRVTPQDIETGETQQINTRKLIDNNVTNYSLGRRVLMLLLTVGLNAVFTAMIISGSPFDTAVFIQLMFQLIMILINITTGFFNGIDGFKKKRLASLLKRREILVEYFGGEKNDKQR